jgi:hypothetical protein
MLYTCTSFSAVGAPAPIPHCTAHRRRPTLKLRIDKGFGDRKGDKSQTFAAYV